MMKICVVLISLLFTKCVSPVKENPNIVSINSVIAECGGRSVLERMKISKIDTATYCLAERLYWEFDSSTELLSLSHTRFYENCAAKMKMVVTKEGNSYAISDIDENKSGLEALCMCRFDTYSEVPLSKTNEISIMINSMVFKLDLSEKSGKFDLDSTIPPDCDGYQETNG